MKEKKNIIIKLSRVKYSGASIGDDIRIQIEVFGNIVSVDNEIKKGGEIKLDTVIGQTITDKTLPSFPVTITVTELDALFNDIGTLQLKLSVDTTDKSPQKSMYRVAVRESRGRVLPSGKQAFFDVTLESTVEPAFWYMGAHADGWITIIRDDNVPEASLPTATKVKINRRTSAREYFTIMEGPLKGINASVKYLKDNVSYFNQKNPQIKPVRAVYSVSKKILTINGKKYLTKDFESSPWAKGFYDIEIPDAPHKGGDYYLAEAPHARTWFRIGHSGDRYLHAGNGSLGCITVSEHGRWEEIYQALITARKGDGVSVGILEVVN